MAWKSDSSKIKNVGLFCICKKQLFIQHTTSFYYLHLFADVALVEKIRRFGRNALLYKEIDRNSLFIGHAVTEDRSRMNIVFTAKDEKTTADFLEFVKPYNIDGIKGYRTVGGFRASCYNALPIESVQVLVDAMQAFEKR